MRYLLNITNTQNENEFTVLSILKSCINLKIDTKLIYSLKYNELIYLILELQIEKVIEAKKMEQNQMNDYEEVDATSSDILKGV